MMKYDRKQAIALLRAYPAMQTVLLNLQDHLDSEEQVIDTYRRRKTKKGSRDWESAGEHLFVFENLSIERCLLQSRVNAIARSLAALSDSERALLDAFFNENYTKDTPFQLMDAFGYEKTQLYHYRGRAIDRFAANMGGLELAPERQRKKAKAG